ncbi:sterol desaturase family protein [Leisingera sp. JC1]|uniref:sterol desaturase family protein n=1 Tax=Leisingera sp. JC1 TaxID=1855282 RepID=UPI0008038E0F|nr:sterol desaturase family protein [Leisingera sp. JC1]OBY24730.1 sterol desaturase [Leisingera sp. JC1]
MKFIRDVIAQLETPREARPLGSGWLSGSMALLAAVTGLLLVLLRWYPETLSYPQTAFVHSSGYVTAFLRFVLLAGYALSLLSLILSRQKSLGWAALGLSVVASLMATAQPQHAGEVPQSLYFGLDYFVVNVLLVGFLFVPLERFFPARREQTVFRTEWREDMFYYLVSSMLVQVLTFLTMAPANYVNTGVDLEGIRTHITNLPFAVQVLIIMAATDFVQYWVHRAFHTFPALWHFHAIHHSAKKMDWLAGARMHFIEIAVLRGLTAVPMFTLGFQPEAIQGYLLIVYFYSSFIHANIGWKLGFMERFLVTPRYHHWHHGSERAAIDINYASHFPLYDWLFGTHHLPEEAWPSKYGVAGDTVPNGYWRQFLYPFNQKRWKKQPEEGGKG